MVFREPANELDVVPRPRKLPAVTELVAVMDLAAFTEPAKVEEPTPETIRLLVIVARPEEAIEKKVWEAEPRIENCEVPAPPTERKIYRPSWFCVLLR